MTEPRNSFSLAMVPFVPWAVYNVAEEKGFWKQRGIEVKVVVHTTEVEYVKVVTEHRSSFYPLPLASTLDFINMGIDLVYLGVLDLANGHKHLIMKTAFLDQPLEGQNIALYSEECTTQYLVARYLKTRGLLLSDVNLIYLDDQALADRFINGDLKLVLAFRGIKEKLRTEGKGTVVFTTADYPDAFGITTDRRTLNNISQSDQQSFFLGRFDALQWIADPANLDEFNTIVNEVTFRGFPDMDEADIQAQRGEVRVPRASDLLALNRSGVADIFNDFKDVVLQNRILDEQYAEKLTFDHMINNRALIEALTLFQSS